MNRPQRFAVLLLCVAGLDGCQRAVPPTTHSTTASGRQGAQVKAAPSAAPTSVADATWLSSLGARVTKKNGHIVQVDLREVALDDALLAQVLALDTRRWKVLRFSGTRVTDAGLANFDKQRLSALRALGMDDTMISSVTLRSVGRLTELVELSCVRAPISDQGLASLRGLDRLRKLRLRGTPITDAGMESISALNSLVSLDVSETRVADAGLEFLKHLSHLESLNLWSTQVGDAGMIVLGAQEKLNWLNLDHTRVTDKGLASIVGLSRLDWLHLGSNDLSDACLPAVAQLKGLDQLILTNCPRITESGRGWLRDAMPDTQIEFEK